MPSDAPFMQYCIEMFLHLFIQNQNMMPTGCTLKA